MNWFNMLVIWVSKATNQKLFCVFYAKLKTTVPGKLSKICSARCPTSILDGKSFLNLGLPFIVHNHIKAQEESKEEDNDEGSSRFLSPRCAESTTGKTATCGANLDGCYIKILGASPASQGCSSENPSPMAALHFQQNFAKPLTSTTLNQSPYRLFFIFFCAWDNCNQNAPAKEVNRSFATTLSSTSQRIV